MNQAAKRPGKSNRRKRNTIAIEQSDGTFLLYQVETCGGRRKIGRHIPVEFAEAPERKAPNAHRV
jgi:hypothetical protein